MAGEPWDGSERRDYSMVRRHEMTDVTEWLRKVDNTLTSHLIEEAKVGARLKNLEDDTGEIKAIVAELREIWTQSKGAMRFITLAIGLFGTAWAVLVWGKDHLKL